MLKLTSVTVLSFPLEFEIIRLNEVMKNDLYCAYFSLEVIVRLITEQKGRGDISLSLLTSECIQFSTIFDNCEPR